LKTFEYKARGIGGKIVTGVLTAPDELSLDRELESRGLFLTKAKSVRSGRNPGKVKLTPRDLVSMTTQLSTLLKAGVPILNALRGLGPQMRTDEGRELISRIADSIQAGRSFSESLAAFPESFGAVFRAAVRAGEMTGSLPPVLANQASFLEWSAEIRSTTLQALFYPLMLIMAITGLVIIMITFVLPRIVNMMPGGQDNLPGPTLFLMRISGFLTGNYLVILGAIGALITAGIWARKQDHIAIAVSRALFHVPRLGDLLSMLAVSRFSRTAATLQDAGCDMLSILEVSSIACGNRAYKANFEKARLQVAAGDRLSDALESQPNMDPLLVQMTRVGEETGELDTCLSQVSTYYDKEVPRTVKWFLALLEPGILLVAGGVVAFILLAAILPMLSLYENM
jgi:type II secretory pathway component PulF